MTSNSVCASCEKTLFFCFIKNSVSKGQSYLLADTIVIVPAIHCEYLVNDYCDTTGDECIIYGFANTITEYKVFP